MKKKIKEAINLAENEKITKRFNNFKNSTIPKSTKQFTDQKLKIEEILNNNSYKLGIIPFEKPDLAKLLLANSHILDLPIASSIKVQMLKSILTDNFQQLYDGQVYYSAISPKNSSIEDTDILVQKLLNKEQIDTQDSENESEEEDGEEEMKHILKQVELFNISVLQEAFNFFNFISNFYGSDFERGGFTLVSASYFNNTEDLHKFLSTINYSTVQSIETDIFSISIKSINLTDLSEYEREVWYKINGQFAKLGIKLFARALDIKKAGQDISEIYHSNNSNLEKTFKAAQELIKTFTYENEEYYPEIAQYCHKYDLAEKIFKRIITDILPHAKIQGDLLPDFKFNIKVKNETFEFSKLPAGGIKTFFLGKMTQCCQFIDGDSEKCVIDGFTKESAGFYIITNSKGKIVAQSYAWIGLDNEGKAVLMLDSYEHLQEGGKLFIPLLEHLANEIQNNGLMQVYVGQGGATPKLTQYPKHTITPKDPSLFEYGDSSSSYKVESGLALQNSEDDNEEIPLYDSFNEFYETNSTRIWNILANNNSINYYKISSLLDYSIVLGKLLSSNLLTIEEIRTIIFHNEKYTPYIFFNSQPFDPATKLELITSAFSKYPNNIKKLFHVLTEINYLSESEINKISSKELLFEVCEESKCLSVLLGSIVPDSMGIERKLNFLGKIPVEHRNSKLINALSQFGIEELEKINLTELVKYIEKNTFYRRGFTNNPNISTDKKIEILNKILEASRNDILKAGNLIEAFSGIDPELLQNIAPDILIKCYEEQHTFPSLFYHYVTNNNKLIIINELFKLYESNLSQMYEMIDKFSYIIPTILNKINFKRLVDYVKDKNLPSILASYSSSSDNLLKPSDNLLKLVVEAFDICKDDNIKLEKALSRLDHIDSNLIITNTKILIDICSKAEDFLPFIFRSCSKLPVIKRAEIINKVFNRYDKAEDNNIQIFNILNGFSNISEIFIDQLDFNVLCNYIEVNSNRTYLFSDQNKSKLELFKMAFEKYSDNIENLTKICTNIDCSQKEIVSHLRYEELAKLIETYEEIECIPISYNIMCNNDDIDKNSTLLGYYLE